MNFQSFKYALYFLLLFFPLVSFSKEKVAEPPTRSEWGPFISYWDSRALDPVYLTTEFNCLKKLKSRRRPVKLMGEFYFKRDRGAPQILMNFHRQKRDGSKGNLENRTFIDSSSWKTFTPQIGEDSPHLNIVDLKKRSELRGSLQIMVMFYGLSYEEMNNEFQTEIKKIDEENWQLTLVPRKKENQEHVDHIMIELEKEKIKTVFFQLPRRESMFFTFTRSHYDEIKGSQFILEIPRGTKITEDKDENNPPK